MTLNDYTDWLVVVQKIHYGRHLIYRFGDYGLSVLVEPVGEGPTYNAAVIKFKGVNQIYDLDYSTPLASSDVLSNKESDVVELLEKLSKLNTQKAI